MVASLFESQRRILLVVSLRSRLRGPGLRDTLKILIALGFRPVLITSYSGADILVPRGVTCYHVSPSLFFRVGTGSVLGRLVAYWLEQVMMVKAVIALRADSREVMFSHILPPLAVVVSRIFRFTTYVLAGGSPSWTAKYVDSRSARLVTALELVTYGCADRVLVVSRRMSDSTALRRNWNKVHPVSIRYFDSEFLREFAYRDPSSKSPTVAYIGRLSDEKGAMDFALAIPIVLKSLPDAMFLVLGDGPLLDKMVRVTLEAGAGGQVSFLGWVENISTFLERIRIVVLPSRTEGTPSVVLEAMMSGTVVLSSPVGGVPDLILDGRTGFLLHSTGPVEIASSLLSLLCATPVLDRVAREARDLVSRTYRAEETLDSWRDALENPIRA